MITSGGSPLDLRFDVSISGAQLDRTKIQRVNIELQENMHNLAVLEMAGIPPSYISSYLNLPITFTVSVGALSSYTFVGYIYSLEPVSKNKDGLVNRSPFQLTKVNCFGATYIMRGKKTRSWENTTLTNLAKQIASTYNFSVSVPDDKYVFPRIAQNGKSDWEILVESANYLGYRVMATGTNIDIWDPFASLSRMGSRPLYAMTGNNGNLTAAPGQVLKFSGQARTDSKTTDTVYSLIGKSVIAVDFNESSGYGTAAQSLYQDEVSENAASYDMATSALTGRNRQKFPITGYAEVVGDPAITPGMVVNLQKYDSALDGLWMVKAVRHEMFKGSSVSFLDLMRDSFFTDTVSPTVVTSPPPIAPESVLRNNRWTTLTEQVYIY